MRILYLGWADHQHLWRWAKHFAQLGHKVWILSDRRSRIPGVKVLRFITAKRGFRFQVKELSFYHRLLRINILHAHWASFGYLPARARIRPYIVTPWGSDIYGYDQFDKESQRRVKIALQNASLITVDSNDLKRAVTELSVSPEKVEIIQWGVNRNLFKPNLKVDKLREQLGINGKHVIYSPRGLDEVYNNDVVLYAFKEVLNKYPDSILIQKYYNAEEREVKEFKDTAKRLGVNEKVRLIGSIPYEEIPLLYNLANVAVSVPSSDGTPMSVLEAMACNVIPVVSDLPSLREWIMDGENGFIVPVRDHKGLSDAIIKIWSGEKRAISSELNIEIIKERADQYKNMEKMERLYMNLIKS